MLTSIPFDRRHWKGYGHVNIDLRVVVYCLPTQDPFILLFVNEQRPIEHFIDSKYWPKIFCVSTSSWLNYEFLLKWYQSIKDEVKIDSNPDVVLSLVRRELIWFNQLKTLESKANDVCLFLRQLYWQNVDGVYFCFCRVLPWLLRHTLYMWRYTLRIIKIICRIFR